MDELCYKICWTVCDPLTDGGFYTMFLASVFVDKDNFSYIGTADSGIAMIVPNSGAIWLVSKLDALGLNARFRATIYQCNQPGSPGTNKWR